MRKFKKSVSVFLAVLCVFSVLSIALTANAEEVKTIRVIVKNDVYSTENGATWDDVLIDDYVELSDDSSMQTVVEDALTENSVEFTFNDWGYLSSISGLSEYACNGSGGWMMTLNDWFTSEASTAYTVSNGGIKDGDEIVVMYSLSWGYDVGSLWGTADTGLKSLEVSGGRLDPGFQTSQKDYTLNIENEEGSVLLTPQAINKNYQVRLYKNEYTPDASGTELNKNSEIDVKNGDVIYIGIGNPGWPTMESSSEETVYALDVIKAPNDTVSDIEKKLGQTADHLLSQPAAVGSIGGEWSVIGLARSNMMTAKYAENYISGVTGYVAENGSAKLHRTKSTENSRVILALTSLGQDVTNVSGDNLLTPLYDFEYVKKQGLNGPMWALIALDSGNYEIPDIDIVNIISRDLIIEYMLNNQTSQGGWGLGSDTPYIDYTAMAVTALAPYYNANEDVKNAIDTAIVIMSEAVDEDKVTSPESYAQILTALCAMGIDPDNDAVFSKVIDGIMSYSCENGFKHELNGEYNQMATEQCYYALTDYLRAKANKTSLYKMKDAFYDINSDYKVDILDAALIQKYVALLADLKDTQKTHSDINNDNHVTIGDVTCLQRYLAGYGAC